MKYLAFLTVSIASVSLLACSSNSPAAASPDGGGSAADAAVRPPNLSGRFGPAGTSATCSTGFQWNGGNSESAQMQPGGDCIGCHTSSREGTIYRVAGTVMGGLNDDDRCAGIGGVTVEITDSAGGKTTLATNPAGNFFGVRRISTPYTAKVIDAQGNERAMVAPQTNLNCATCHTSIGVNGAPGRVLAP